MDSQPAFAAFIPRVVVPEKADRYVTLSQNKRGQRKILRSLSSFESDIKPSAIRPRNYDALLEKPCYVFHSPTGFGIAFPTVREACDRLSLDDPWLILLTDASAAIFRPEAPRWDKEILIS